MWKKYKVTWDFRGRLCGSVPLNDELIGSWLDARKPSVRPPGARSIAEITNEAISTLAREDIEQENQDLEKRTTLGFQNIDGNLVMRGGTIKAHLKDCSRIISSFSAKIKGERSFAIKVLNCIYVEEYWVPILVKGSVVKASHGTFEKAVHVMTRQGPMNALKRINYIERPMMKFTLNVMESPRGEVVNIKDLELLFTYGGIHGYAGERGDGEGRYTFKIEEE